MLNSENNNNGFIFGFFNNFFSGLGAIFAANTANNTPNIPVNLPQLPPVDNSNDGDHQTGSFFTHFIFNFQKLLHDYFGLPDPVVNHVATIGGETAGEVVKNSADELVTTGVLTIADQDPGQAKFQVQNDTQGQYGTFDLDANGNWKYTADNDNPAIQALVAGETLTETFEVRAVDGTISQVTIQLDPLEFGVSGSVDFITVETLRGENGADGIAGAAGGAGENGHPGLQQNIIDSSTLNKSYIGSEADEIFGIAFGYEFDGIKGKGGDGGNGGNGIIGGNGGAGGNGNYAWAEIGSETHPINMMGHGGTDNLMVQAHALSAGGGQGGNGGIGLTTSGHGGKGGDGGDATAIINYAFLDGGTGDDRLNVDAIAQAGEGGLGGMGVIAGAQGAYGKTTAIGAYNQLNGGDGNDELNLVIHTTLGQDSSVSVYNNQMRGDGGNDVINLGATSFALQAVNLNLHDNELIGGAGDDSLGLQVSLIGSVNIANNKLDGGEGNDILGIAAFSGFAFNSFNLTMDHNEIIGGAGTDTLIFVGEEASVNVDLEAGTFSFINENAQITSTNNLIIGIEKVIGTDGNDILKAGVGSTTIDGSLGDDHLFASQDGQDTFVFTQGILITSENVQEAVPSGNDKVSNFHLNSDKLDVSSYHTDFNSLTIQQVGADTQILLPGGHSSILLENIDSNNLAAGDFLF